MLVDEIRKKMFEAMKEKRATDKSILQVAMGEISNAETRSGKALSDEEAQSIIRKIIKSNSETLAVTDRDETKVTLHRENEVLNALLPQRWDADRIAAELAPLAEQIKGAASDGAATGVAMKHLKTAGAPVDGKDVSAAVKKLRA